jgi:23S rRNA pseudouridine2604 synthase
MTAPIRLSKRVAELCVCSRRKAEQLITGGWVKVNGMVVEEPHARVADERIDVDPKADPSQAEPVTLLLHKPPSYHAIEGDQPAAQLLNTASHWAEDESGMPLLKKHFTQLTACVPLETEASGLVVFTRDWHVSRRLSEDASMIEHEMIVEVTGDMVPNALKKMNQGIRFNGRTPTAIKVSWQNETRLRIALKGAQVGQIAHLCEAAGLQVVSMKRIRLGGVSLGKVPPGQWRYLRMDERF